MLSVESKFEGRSVVVEFVGCSSLFLFGMLFVRVVWIVSIGVVVCLSMLVVCWIVFGVGVDRWVVGWRARY